MIPSRDIQWMRSGEKLVTETMVGAAPLTGATLLPGWDRATVLAHLAGNANGLLNLLSWARTGVEKPMYAGPAEREAEIARILRLDPAALLDEVARTGTELDRAVTDLPETAWSALVRTNSGRDVPASVVPFMRVREVYIHAADLNVGTGFGAIPEDVRIALIDDVVAALSAKPHCPYARLRSGDRTWLLGTAPATPDAGRGEPGTSETAQVQSPDTAQLLAWLVGRSQGLQLSFSGPRPSLPHWL